MMEGVDMFDRLHVSFSIRSALVLLVISALAISNQLALVLASH